MPGPPRPSRFAALTLSLCAVGCTREPIQQICPRLAAGALVLTELRGPQTGADTWGQWVELYNAAGAEVRLAGVQLHVMRQDGSGEVEIMVRDRDLTVAVGAYAVLGRFKPGELPPHVQYGFRGDYDTDLPDRGIVELLSCGVVLDTIVYDKLPSLGSLSFDGGRAPDAKDNDDKTRWCTDGAPPDPAGRDGGAPQLGVPGTPARSNRPCS